MDIPATMRAAVLRAPGEPLSIETIPPPRPRANEVLFALGMARGGRVHSRMGGLEIDQVKGEDGLR